MFKKALLSLTLGAAISSCSLIVQAQSVNEMRARMAPLAAQANFQWLNSLTPRQRYLERAISEVSWNYYQQTGSGIFPNEQNLLILMQQIGAYPQEASWIYTRLQHHYLVDEALNKSDRVLQDTQNTLDCMNAGGGVNCWR